MTNGDMKPHRGVLVLVFGILGLVFCIIFGILAWVWGNSDLREMQAGRMDPEGEQLTKVGKILGMVGVIVFVVAICLGLAFGVLGAVLGG